VEKKVKEIADKFNLKSLLNRPPYRLSTGEKRRVTLASILSYDPDLLLLDEPTANLSAKYVEETTEIIANAKDMGKAVVIASHDANFVAEISDRVYVLSDGFLTGD